MNRLESTTSITLARRLIRCCRPLRVHFDLNHALDLDAEVAVQVTTLPLLAADPDDIGPAPEPLRIQVR